MLYHFSTDCSNGKSSMKLQDRSTGNHADRWNKRQDLQQETHAQRIGCRGRQPGILSSRWFANRVGPVRHLCKKRHTHQRRNHFSGGKTTAQIGGGGMVTFDGNVTVADLATCSCFLGYCSRRGANVPLSLPHSKTSLFGGSTARSYPDSCCQGSEQNSLTPQSTRLFFFKTFYSGNFSF